LYNNKSMAGEQDRNIKLFVDVDGRLSELLSQLNIETTEVRGIGDSDLGKPRGYRFVEMSDSAADTALLALQEEPKSGTPANRNSTGPSKGDKPAAARTRLVKRSELVGASLLAHAVETFGSERIARKWLSSECGALHNRTPLQVIQSEGNETEVERILDCIDYGMLA
jgi:hypothetical protein